MRELMLMTYDPLPVYEVTFTSKANVYDTTRTSAYFSERPDAEDFIEGLKEVPGRSPITLRRSELIYSWND